jgi:hypothetical protein
LDNVDRANRKAEVRAELTKRLDVKRPDIRARGTLLKYRLFQRHEISRLPAITVHKRNASQLVGQRRVREPQR